MRKVNAISDLERTNLNDGFHNSTKYRFRNRCQAILLSDQNMPVAQIAQIFKVRTRTIYTWFDNFERYGISGLISVGGRGAKSKLDDLNEEQIEKVKKAVNLNPQSLKKVCDQVSEILGFKVSKQMLKRLFKKNLGTLGDASESVSNA